MRDFDMAMVAVVLLVIFIGLVLWVTP